MGGGVLEPVVAPEQLVVDRERRNPKHTELNVKRGVGLLFGRPSPRQRGQRQLSKTIVEHAIALTRPDAPVPMSATGEEDLAFAGVARLR